MIVLRGRTSETAKVQVFKFEKGSIESTHKVPTSNYHTKHCHAAVKFAKGSVESTHKVPTSHYHTKHTQIAKGSAQGTDQPL